jgi:hypothetical protein
MSRVTTRSDLGQPVHRHTWRTDYDDDGGVRATVDLGTAEITFHDPADARAVAAECIKAADAMEQMAAEIPPARTGEVPADGQ